MSRRRRVIGCGWGAAGAGGGRPAAASPSPSSLQPSSSTFRALSCKPWTLGMSAVVSSDKLVPGQGWGSDIARGKDTKSKCCKICLYESRGRIIRARPQQFSTSTDGHVSGHVTRVTVHVAPGNHGDKPQPRCGAAQCEHWTSLPPRDHGCQLPLMQWQWPVPSTTATVTRPRSPAPSVQVGSPTLLFPPVTATLATPQPQLCSATPVQLQP